MEDELIKDLKKLIEKHSKNKEDHLKNGLSLGRVCYSNIFPSSMYRVLKYNDEVIPGQTAIEFFDKDQWDIQKVKVTFEVYNPD